MESNEARKCFSMKWIWNMRARNRLSFFLMSCFPHRHKCYLQLPQCSSDTHSFLYDKTLCDLVVRCVCIKATITKWMKREEKKWKWRNKPFLGSSLVVFNRLALWLVISGEFYLFGQTCNRRQCLVSFSCIDLRFSCFVLCFCTAVYVIRLVVYFMGQTYTQPSWTASYVVRWDKRQETLRSNWWPSDSAV